MSSIPKQKTIGIWLGTMTVYPHIFFFSTIQTVSFVQNSIKESQISLRGSRDAQSRALTNRFIVVQGKGQSFTASKLSGQLNPLQRNNMTVKYTSCASVVLACV